MDRTSIPELHGDGAVVRIPEQRSVPLTRRVGALIEHPAFQRLRTVRQLGPTHLVYPGAVHSRFEHSLGVYDLARQYLLALLRDAAVAAHLSEADITVCLLGALLHDLGHYPFAHSLEALHRRGADTPRHEDLMGAILLGEVAPLRGPRTLATLVREGFGLDPVELVDFVRRKPAEHARPARRLVATILSSAIDADKADYLERDALHMGVPFGRQGDRARLLDALCVNAEGDALAVTSKGKVAAEVFLFSRYTMFSEAYWHHTVRSASAMVERAFADVQERDAPEPSAWVETLLGRSDDVLLETLLARAPAESLAARLLGAMTGGRRDLYKRLLTLNRAWDDARVQRAYDRIYLLDGAGIDDLSRHLAECLGRLLRRPVHRDDVIVDTPPRDKDRTEMVDVMFGDGGARHAMRLDEVSRLAAGIATDFVKYVKKIRIFVAPAVAASVRDGRREEDARDALLQTIVDYIPTGWGQQTLFIGGASRGG